MKSLSEQIENCLVSGEYDLAIKRYMDMAYESGIGSHIEKSIEIKLKHENNDATWYKDLQSMLTTTSNEKNVNPLDYSLSDVSKIYSKGKFQLSSVNYSFSGGEVIGIVGENGNGKTTLLRLMADRLSCTNGKIIWPEELGNTHYELKSSIAYIPQRIPRWYGKLKDNLHFNASVNGDFGYKNDLYVNYVLERFNLKKYADLTWDQISSGYKTRFEIAKIVMQRPNLLILDEPLANLDINAQQTLLTDLKMMVKASNRRMTILLSSQQLYEVEKIADKIIMLKNGKIVETLNGLDEGTVSIIEFESSLSKNELINFFPEGSKLENNGAYYTLSSGLTPSEVINIFAKNQLPLSYYRDITYSSKRFFNN